LTDKEKKEKGFKVKLFNNNYFLILKENGLYFKNKTKNKNFDDIFIPYEKINHLEGICKEDPFFLKFRYETLLKIYFFLSVMFLFIVPKSSFFVFFLSLFFLFFIWFVFYMKTTYLVIYADYERIPVQLGDNARLCYLIQILKKKVKRRLKDKISFVFKYKVKEIKDLAEEIKKEKGDS
jgi:hypothetical protein